jgi:hypothetical protein
MTRECANDFQIGNIIFDKIIQNVRNWKLKLFWEKAINFVLQNFFKTSFS